MNERDELERAKPKEEKVRSIYESSVGFGLGWQIAMRLDSLANRWDPK